MATGLNIRSLDWPDFKDLEGLDPSTYPAKQDKRAEPEDDGEPDDDFLAWTWDAWVTILVAEVGGHAVGLAVLANHGEGIYELIWVGVSPELRGRRIGAAPITRAREPRRVHMLYVDVGGEDSGLTRWLRRLGFRAARGPRRSAGGARIRSPAAGRANARGAHRAGANDVGDAADKEMEVARMNNHRRDTRRDDEMASARTITNEESATDEPRLILVGGQNAELDKLIRRLGGSGAPVVDGFGRLLELSPIERRAATLVIRCSPTYPLLPEPTVTLLGDLTGRRTVLAVWSLGKPPARSGIVIAASRPADGIWSTLHTTWRVDAETRRLRIQPFEKETVFEL